VKRIDDREKLVASTRSNTGRSSASRSASRPRYRLGDDDIGATAGLLEFTPSLDQTRAIGDVERITPVAAGQPGHHRSSASPRRATSPRSRPAPQIRAPAPPDSTGSAVMNTSWRLPQRRDRTRIEPRPEQPAERQGPGAVPLALRPSPCRGSGVLTSLHRTRSPRPLSPVAPASDYFSSARAGTVDQVSITWRQPRAYGRAHRGEVRNCRRSRASGAVDLVGGPDLHGLIGLCHDRERAVGRKPLRLLIPFSAMKSAISSVSIRWRWATAPSAGALADVLQQAEVAENSICPRRAAGSGRR